MNADWKVFTNHKAPRDSIEVWFLKYEGGKPYYASVSKSGWLELHEYEEGTNPSPTLEIPRFVWPLIVEAINEIEPPVKKEVVDAELEATKRHLEDMRSLVFKNKKP